jgi:hypothetical protein
VSVQTLELPASICAEVVYRKEVASLEHLGWTRQLVRETCIIDGTSYGKHAHAAHAAPFPVRQSLFKRQSSCCCRLDHLSNLLWVHATRFPDTDQAVTFGFGELYQLPPVLRAETYSGQTVLGKPARGGRVGSPTK